MLYLFIKPFTAIDIPDKIRRDLKWNIWMSGINLGTTIGVAVGHLLISDQFAYLWTADRVVNVVTCFLMIRCNRQWLEQRIFYRHVGVPFVEMQRMYVRLNPRHKLQCGDGHDVLIAKKSFLLRFDTSDLYSEGFTCTICQTHFPYFEYTFHCFLCNIHRYDVCADCGMAKVRQQKAEHPTVVSYALRTDANRPLPRISESE